MASSSTATPDTMVTIKVNIEGQNKRLKVPLRDLGATTLPDKLRKELQIPSTLDVRFERYSDSAAAFIYLDPNQPSVYKQLYRAAKAKLKLRIKATIMAKEPTSARQATVEDELPGTDTESRPSQAIETPPTVKPSQPKQSIPQPGPRKIVSLPVAHTPSVAPKFSQSIAELESRIENLTKANQTPLPSVVEIQRGIEDLMTSRSKRQVTPNDLHLYSRNSRQALRNSLLDLPETQKTPTTGTEVPVSRGDDGLRDFFEGLSVRKSSPFSGKFAKDAEPLRAVSAFSSQLPSMEVPLKQCPYAQANSSFTVFCNSCSRSISNYHYHCGVCDDGDFDLCMDCTGRGVTCSDDSHWMIKRTIENGKVSSSTTETLPPKTIPTYDNSTSNLIETETEAEVEAEAEEQIEDDASRTCNSCIQEFTEENFVTCTVCEDYDLCIPCHKSLKHGHDPKHAFAPAVEDHMLDPLAYALLQPGRNAGHHAICDGCDKYVYGVRHKCLDCPDWDYCATCIVNAKFIHPGHRFVPIYEPLGDVHESLHQQSIRVKHTGIYCDGPLCNSASNPNTSYIVGDRYKCAVCHDTDFCAACEASPSNQHNKTHPLIKFKTMIRNVSVTTMGDHVDGQRMKVMGDRLARKASKATETMKTRSANAATQVQTVADLQPTEPIKTEEVKSEAVKPEPVEAKVAEVKDVKPTPSIVASPAPVEELKAHFVRDTVADGTNLPSNHVFEQTWFLRNSGSQAWPAGCSVKFVGGDNMCAVDPEHPASVHELVSAAESTVCYTEVAPGQETAFTVLMRTPSRAGKIISYWRLTGPNGVKFGHKLWCDVNVEKPVEQADNTSKAEVKQEEPSKMVFPTLEKESPTSSLHESEVAENANVEEAEADEFEDYYLEDEEHDFDDETEDGFLTDEEYDILDASDEEYLMEQSKASKK